MDVSLLAVIDFFRGSVERLHGVHDFFLTVQPFSKNDCASFSAPVEKLLTVNHFLSVYFKNVHTVKPFWKFHIVKFLIVNHFAGTGVKKFHGVIDSFRTDNPDGLTRGVDVHTDNDYVHTFIDRTAAHGGSFHGDNDFFEAGVKTIHGVQPFFHIVIDFEPEGGGNGRGWAGNASNFIRRLTKKENLNIVLSEG